MSVPACTTTVTSDGGYTLPATGIDASTWAPVAVIAAVLLAAGVTVLIVRVRRTRTPALVVLLAALILSGALPAPAAHATDLADTAPACALIRIGEVTAQSTAPLVPGQNTTGLRYTVINITDMPLDVTVTTTVTSDPGTIADDLHTILTLGGDHTSIGTLDHSPAPPSLRLLPGATATVEYTLTLADTVDNTGQGRTVHYDSTLTATQAPGEPSASAEELEPGQLILHPAIITPVRR
ncbi:LPXTG cell wall anchor domain-containing protein [Microbacterium sp. NPDC077663]|uniref:LPXTG cell wall anchor domain-containing protein n=1 Tax=Microbacterium sp. NPDC077663 TaxID=3364189 RepID=UPI0037C81B3F